MLCDIRTSKSMHKEQFIVNILLKVPRNLDSLLMVHEIHWINIWYSNKAAKFDCNVGRYVNDSRQQPKCLFFSKIFFSFNFNFKYGPCGWVFGMSLLVTFKF